MAAESFRRQHEELQSMARDVLANADPVVLARDADAARRELDRLAKVLQGHAALEDEKLYPVLFRHADETVRTTALHLHDAFGPLYDAFLDFARRWSAAGAIERDAAAYVSELRSVIVLLSQRISQENTELYTLVGGLAD